MNRDLFNGGIGEEWIDADNTLTNTYRVRINLPDATGDTLIANYPVITQGTSIEDNAHLQLSDKNLFLRVLKTNATTVDDVKTWLQSNPLTIVYELAEPYYETIDTDRLLLEIPNNATVSVKSVVPVQSMAASYTNGIPNVYGLQETNQVQDDLINISLLATDEMYTMLEPILESIPQVINNERTMSKMVDMYVAMVIRGLKTIEDVPARYRKEVQDILNKLEK